MRIPYKGAGIALFCNKGSDTYILLGKRSDYPFHNRWSVPGGGVDKVSDKSDLDNAKREFYEETGIVFDSFHSEYQCSWKLKFPLFSWKTFIYKTEQMTDGFTPNEFYELKWINISDVRKYKLRPFTKREIRSFCINRH